ncbi:unannotated protein [freshwater metagenome]|uniref:Unannotated protein n=1 Tax=freshwater metagenome TaxID=449393 RepID=A0A6J6BMG3_9ZZZZ
MGAGNRSQIEDTRDRTSQFGERVHTLLQKSPDTPNQRSESQSERYKGSGRCGTVDQNAMCAGASLFTFRLRLAHLTHKCLVRRNGRINHRGRHNLDEPAGASSPKTEIERSPERRKGWVKTVQRHPHRMTNEHSCLTDCKNICRPVELGLIKFSFSDL